MIDITEAAKRAEKKWLDPNGRGLLNDIIVAEFAPLLSEKDAEIDEWRRDCATTEADRDRLVAHVADRDRAISKLCEKLILALDSRNSVETNCRRLEQQVAGLASLHEYIDELLTEVAELRRDAERYRELRDGESRFSVADYGAIRPGEALIGGALDMEIDSALGSHD